MRMRSWASALAIALCGAAWADGGVLPATLAAPGQTRLGSGAGSIVVSRDEHVPARAKPTGAERVGALGSDVLIIIDSYPSRLSQGAGACGAGKEQFLRVLRLLPRPVKETFRLKLASCWTGIEVQGEFGRNGLKWDADTGTLDIEWLAGPATQAPERRRLQIGTDGAVKDIKPA